MLRFAVAAAFGAALLLPASSPASSAGSAPVITLLSPANGATVRNAVGTDDYPVFTWHVDWATPEATIVRWEIATDPAFTKNTSVNTASCLATNPNCWTSIQPHAVYGPPLGSVWYWRVGLTTSAGIVYSPTFSFNTVTPADGDRDGIADASDNCPATPNADQRDSNRDGKGDACQADRTKPRVKVYAGSARRGQRAFIRARTADDRGDVRLRVSLGFKGHVFFRGSFGWTPSAWAVTRTFYTRAPLPHLLPRGTYSACVTAWDRAGNSRTACAPYRVR